MNRSLERLVLVAGLSLIGVGCSADDGATQKPATGGGSAQGGTGTGGGTPGTGGGTAVTGGTSATTGGTSTASGGQSATGGQASGGTASGGTATGGSSTGGTATGGTATGGTATGGTSSGGSSPGGAATGGSGGKASGGSGGAATGGTATGGSAGGNASTGGSGGAGTGGGVGTGGSSGGASCATLVTPIERSGNYVLEFGNTYFAAKAAGGKIIEFRSRSGSNLLTGTTVNDLNYGSTLWTSPQSAWNWPPPVAVDSGTYTATVDETTGTITLVQSAAPDKGPNIRMTKVFKANLCEDAIDVTYTIQNATTAALASPLAAWEVSRVFAGGIIFFPPASASAQPNIKNDPTTATPITITNQSSLWWYSNPASSTAGSKLYADGANGWLAFTKGTDLYVKTWTDVPSSSQISGEAEIEVYNGGTYVELEVQGPAATLAANGSTSFQMRWYVRTLASAGTVGDAALVSAVTALTQ